MASLKASLGGHLQPMLRCASPLFPSLSPSPAPSPSLTISGQHGQHEGVPRGSSSTAHAERFPWHAHARAPFNSPPFLFPPTTSLSHHLQANMANRKASLGGHLQPMLKDFHHTHMRVLIPTYPFLFSQLLSLTLLVSPHYPLPAPPKEITLASCHLLPLSPSPFLHVSPPFPSLPPSTRPLHPSPLLTSPLSIPSSLPSSPQWPLTPLSASVPFLAIPRHTRVATIMATTIALIHHHPCTLDCFLSPPHTFLQPLSCPLTSPLPSLPPLPSVGSDEEYSFEESMFRHYRSQPYTLDPFLSPQAQARMQLLRFLHFHSLGLAGKASLGDYQKWNPNVTFRTLPELMQDLNHTYIDILKLSCGGCEEEVIFDVFEGSVNGTAEGAGRGMREKVDQFRSLEEAAEPAAPAETVEPAAPAETAEPAAPAETAEPAAAADAAAAAEPAALTAAGTGAAEPAGAVAEPGGAVAEPGGASGSGSGGVRNYEEGREDAVDPSVGARLAINGGKLSFGQLVVDFH
ncbi:unnamed protein product, partial [Closterium sp. NIES-53]